MTRALLYARISTKDGRQTLANQRQQLERYARKANWKVVRIIEEAESSTKKNRPGLEEIRRAAANREMDVLCVVDLSRLSRSGPTDVFQLIADLGRHKVDLWSINEPHFRTAGTGELFLAIVSYMAKYEREQISTRVKSGLRTAKANGKNLGRPRKIISLKTIEKMKAAGKSLSQIAESTGCEKTTIWRRLKAIQK